MKQKVTVTREQIEKVLRGKLFKFEYDPRMGNPTPFPDSIEVEVDVPDVIDAQEKLAASMAKSMQSYKLMAPAIVLVNYGNEEKCLTGILFSSFNDAHAIHGKKLVHWPATIDPATGMYKVPVKEEE